VELEAGQRPGNDQEKDHIRPSRFKGYTVQRLEEGAQYYDQSDTTDIWLMHKGSALKKLKANNERAENR